MRISAICKGVFTVFVWLVCANVVSSTAQTISPADKSELRKEVERSIKNTPGSDTEKYRAGERAVEKFYGERAGTSTSGERASGASTSSTFSGKWQAGMERAESISTGAEGAVDSMTAQPIGIVIILLGGWLLGLTAGSFAVDQGFETYFSRGVCGFIMVPIMIVIGIFVLSGGAGVSPFNLWFALPGAAGAMMFPLVSSLFPCSKKVTKLSSANQFARQSATLSKVEARAPITKDAKKSTSSEVTSDSLHRRFDSVQQLRRTSFERYVIGLVALLGLQRGGGLDEARFRFGFDNKGAFFLDYKFVAASNGVHELGATSRTISSEVDSEELSDLVLTRIRASVMRLVSAHPNRFGRLDEDIREQCFESNSKQIESILELAKQITTKGVPYEFEVRFRDSKTNPALFSSLKRKDNDLQKGESFSCVRYKTAAQKLQEHLNRLSSC